MTKDSVTRAIQRGTGELDGVSYEEARYEGYGPGGAALMVDCLTDDRSRTVAEVRHAFAEYGGQLGADGSVSYLFNQVGHMIYAPGTDLDHLMAVSLQAGAEDVLVNEDGSLEVLTDPLDFVTVRAQLQADGFPPALSEITQRASTTAARWPSAARWPGSPTA